MRFGLFSINFLLSISFVVGGKIQGVVQVHNGENAKPNSHPWLLSMEIRIKDGSQIIFTDHTCGASLLRVPYMEHASDIAVTAAHCVEDPEDEKPVQACSDPSMFKSYAVVAAKHNYSREDKDIRVQVADGMCFPGYDRARSREHDIALLKLAQPLPFSEKIKPIDLPGAGVELVAGEVCSTAGWGNTKYRIEYPYIYSDTLPNVLQEINVTIASHLECKNRLASEAYNMKSMICHQVLHAKHLLEGDSGGALVCQKHGKNTIFGVASFASYSRKVETSVFTKVSNYREWLDCLIDESRNPAEKRDYTKCEG